ncbi:MAG: LysR family transcriptional regulator [Granulosicoccaceae bacterium]
MQTFVRVVQSGSFSSVAVEMASSQATVSKRIARLEQHLGTQLLIRHSRGQYLTDAGKSYYVRALCLLEALEEAENEVRSQNYSPTGLIRVTMPTTFGRLVVLPLMDEFYQRYPQLSVQFVLHDRVLGLLTEGLDLAIRAGELQDSTLNARRLGVGRYCLVASKAYIKKYGCPQQPKDIVEHECLLYSLSQNSRRWSFQMEGKQVDVPVKARFYADSSDFLLDAVTRGLGIAVLPNWVAHDGLASGQLVRLLDEYVQTPIPITALYSEQQHLPQRVRVMIDYFAEKIETLELLLA